jgi:hypothetical protein
MDAISISNENIIEYFSYKNYMFSTVNKNWLNLYKQRFNSSCYSLYHCLDYRYPKVKKIKTSILNNLSINTLKFAIDNGYDIMEKTYLDLFNIIREFAKINESEFIKFLQIIECKWKYQWKETYLPALCSQHGYINALKYLHENNNSWNELTLYNAIDNNQLNCVKYFHENCDYSKYRTFDNAFISHAAGYNSYECLKYLYSHNYILKSEAFNFAIRNGNFDCIKYLYEKKCPYKKNSELVKSAIHGILIRKTNIEILKYVIEVMRCQLDSDTISDIIMYYLKFDNNINCLEIIKYLKYHNCPTKNTIQIYQIEEKHYKSSSYVCSRAVYYGNLELLKLLHKMEYDCDGQTLYLARNNSECLNYLIENNCSTEYPNIDFEMETYDSDYD